jgi:hypothetical protein
MSKLQKNGGKKLMYLKDSGINDGIYCRFDLFAGFFVSRFKIPESGSDFSLSEIKIINP